MLVTNCNNEIECGHVRAHLNIGKFGAILFESEAELCDFIYILSGAILQLKREERGERLEAFCNQIKYGLL